MSKITLFFFNLTKNNWGFPWHIIGMMLAMLLLRKIESPWELRPFYFVGLFIFGYLYEVLWQGKQKDTLQDLVANSIGLILGVFL